MRRRDALRLVGASRLGTSTYTADLGVTGTVFPLLLTATAILKKELPLGLKGLMVGQQKRTTCNNM